MHIRIGQHSNRPNRIPENVVARIDKHIKSFPREASHYKIDARQLFLAADLSVRIMHRLYLSKYEPHISIGDSGSGGSGDDRDNADGKEHVGGDGGGGGGVEDSDDEAVLEQKPQVKYDFYLERYVLPFFRDAMLLAVSTAVLFRRFKRFDLKFGKPEVDSCATCDEFKLQISAAVDEDVAAVLRAQKKSHLLEADRAYKMRYYYYRYHHRIVIITIIIHP